MKYTSEQLFKKEMDKVKGLENKPTLLLHSCCGPCGTYPIDLLSDYFELTIFYNNSNIFPLDEYNKRLVELQNYVTKINESKNKNIKIIVPEYENERFNKILSSRAEDPEGGTRCHICYSLRYEQLAKYAKDKYDYICSAMTISRHKNEEVINKILSGYAKKNNVNYLYSNFKKNKGLEIAQRIAKENNMYKQNYCGCIFSLNNKR